MKIVVLLLCAVNPREFNGFRCLTEGAAGGPAARSAWRGRAGLGLHPAGGFAQAGRAKAVAGGCLCASDRHRQAVSFGIAPARADIVAPAAELLAAALADQASLGVLQISALTIAMLWLSTASRRGCAGRGHVHRCGYARGCGYAHGHDRD
jgi:hypothetical protein